MQPGSVFPADRTSADAGRRECGAVGRRLHLAKAISRPDQSLGVRRDQQRRRRVRGPWTRPCADDPRRDLGGSDDRPARRGRRRHVGLHRRLGLRDDPSRRTRVQPRGDYDQLLLPARIRLRTSTSCWPPATAAQAGDFSIEVLPNGRLRGWHTGQDDMLRFFEGTGGITGTNLQVGTAHRIDLSLGPQGARIYLDGAELPAAAIPANTNGWNNGRVKYLGRWTDGVQDAGGRRVRSSPDLEPAADRRRDRRARSRRSRSPCRTSRASRRRDRSCRCRPWRNGCRATSRPDAHQVRLQPEPRQRQRARARRTRRRCRRR